jgi:hypothetical protein
VKHIRKEVDFKLSKKKLYLILDTETATLPYIEGLKPSDKQKISISKPLIYDIGWIIQDRKGNILEKKNFLIQEIFFTPIIFNTAYYKEKRPLYIDMVEKNKIEVKKWNEVTKNLLTDLQKVEFCSAYNACFDYKKAIPFTDNYITALYSNHFQIYEEQQKASIKRIIKNEKMPSNSNYLDSVFELKGLQFPIVDIWAVACEYLLNNRNFKNYCFNNHQFTKSGLYFCTTAENCYNFLNKNPNFVESHTALSDSIIEGYILKKAFERYTIKPVLQAFPFKKLGSPQQYIQDIKKNKILYSKILLEYFEKYFEGEKNPSKQAVKNYNELLELIQ